MAKNWISYMYLYNYFPALYRKTIASILKKAEVSVKIPCFKPSVNIISS